MVALFRIFAFNNNITTMIPEELKKFALQQMIDEGIISLKIYKYREPGEFTEKIWERYISLH